MIHLNHVQIKLILNEKSGTLPAFGLMLPAN